MYMMYVMYIMQNEKLIQTTGRTSLEILDELWSLVTVEQKINLLKVMGYNESWPEAKTISEMSSRGGAMVQRDLIRLFEKTQKKGST